MFYNILFVKLLFLNNIIFKENSKLFWEHDLCVVDSPALRTLHSKFKQIVSENRIKCLSFGETEKQSVGYKRIKVLIVPPESSGKRSKWLLFNVQIIVNQIICFWLHVKIRKKYINVYIFSLLIFNLQILVLESFIRWLPPI